jgi:DNA segregation ATPase FtsK/SpoIIIE-like protein
MAEQQTASANADGSGRLGQLRDLVGLVIVLSSLFVFLSLIFHKAPDYTMESPEPTNKTGEIGAMVAQELLFSLGYGAYFLAGLALFFGSMIFLRIRIVDLFQRIVASVLFLVSSLLLGALVTPDAFQSQIMMGYGGSYGQFMLDLIVPYVGRFGAYMATVLGYTLTLSFGTSIKLYPFVQKFVDQASEEASKVKPTSKSPASLFETVIQWGVTLLFLPLRGLQFIGSLIGKAFRAGILKTQSGVENMMDKRREVYDKLLKDREEAHEERKEARQERDLGHTPAPPDGATPGDAPDPSPEPDAPEPDASGPDVTPEPPSSNQTPEPAKASTEPVDTGQQTMTEEAPSSSKEQQQPATTQTSPQPSKPSTSEQTTTSETSDESGRSDPDQQDGSSSERSVLAPDVDQDYDLPPLSLLTEPESDSQGTDRSKVEKNKEVIQETLDSFGIDGKVVNSSTGPVITMYEVELAPGVQVSKLTSCSDDLAISLKAPSVRIVYPIPGKSTVGIEVPQNDRGIVRVRELWENVGNKANDYRIPLLLGRSAEGEPVHIDLADMPHLLIAGTTGSGKSVCLKNIVIGQLLCRTPQELKLLMVDPKRVELTRFEGIPHLISPIIKNMRKVTEAFEWLVDYMEERYKLLQLTNCTDLDEFNAMSEEEAKERLEKNGMDPEMYPGYQPRIIAVVDELGDLMSVSSKEVETTVTRIAQKARAVGIHMILSTQRPSSEVITGLIKSNMPARISFKVMSGTNSRIIIDQNGAEDLIGDGDMLLSLPDREQPIRSQGALIEEDEIQNVCSFWKDEAGKLRNDSLPDIPKVEEGMSAEEREMKDNLEEQQQSEDNESTAEPEEERGTEQVDDLFEDAVDVVVTADRGSVSLIQRKLQIGYTRASRIMEQMAEEGLVGPHRGNKPREVLIDEDEWRKLKEDGQML